MKVKSILFSFFFSSFFCFVISFPFSVLSRPGRVIHIADADTITVLKDHKQIPISLYGIDAPDKGQPFGSGAKDFTLDMAKMKRVEVVPIAVDSNGRTVASVYIEGDGENLAEELVQAGYARVYLDCKRRICGFWLKLESRA
ncbi:MAG: thermonuclease family protein [Desulfohalobiaceae bacterium]|nr:thermonuclease family protein [Desulfohalobiaceae bacterium]